MPRSAEPSSPAACAAWTMRCAAAASVAWSAVSWRTVWVAAVAYDRDGRVVGWRRWESGAAMRAGIANQFQMHIYSLAGAISRLELSVQARP